MSLKILLWTDDLMSRTRIESRWKIAGAQLVKRNDEATADLLVMDLGAKDALSHIERLRTERPELEIIAYGPHVDGAAFKAAREAGATEVVARGQVVVRIARRLS